MPRIFSYGTLRQPEVQRANYRRLLDGEADALVGYRVKPLTISDPEVVRMSGKDVHTIACFTGNPLDRIDGMLFEVTAEELAATDGYEVDAYARLEVTLASGRRAIVYVGEPLVE